MTASLQRELAPIAEIIKTTNNHHTQRFHNAQQEEVILDSTSDLDTQPEAPQDQQQKSTDGSDIPA
jgi:hypothetical protein